MSSTSTCPSCQGKAKVIAVSAFSDAIDRTLQCSECKYQWTETLRKRITDSAILMFSLAVIMLFAGHDTAMAQEGFATYYTTESCQREGTSGIFTANGERFDESALTCALPSAKFNSHWLVYSQDTMKSIVVRCNDRGPGKGPQKRGVIIDLTPEGMRQLGIKGKALVNIQEVIE